MSDRKERIEANKRAFDKLCEGPTSQVMLDIYGYENSHYRRVSKEYGRFIAQFELAYDLIVESVHAINYIEKSNWPKHRGIQFLTLVNNLKPLFSAFERLIKGFYEDSLILARPVYESFIKIIYIICYPSYPYEVLMGRRDPDGKRFNLTNFLKDELKLNWHDYSYLSAMAHANFYSIMKEAADISQKKTKEATALKFRYDEKLLTLGINDISLLSMVYLNLIVELFATQTNDILSAKMIDKAKRYIELRHESFLLHPKEHLPQVVMDIKDIFAMVKRVESGEEWKKTWQEIRAKTV